MVKILICDDDPTFAQSMFKRILSLPAYSSKSMKLSCLTDIAEMSANTIENFDKAISHPDYEDIDRLKGSITQV